jgi:beta-D-xylosidase 4
MTVLIGALALLISSTAAWMTVATAAAGALPKQQQQQHAPQCRFLMLDTDLTVPGQAPTGTASTAADCCSLCQRHSKPFFVWNQPAKRCYCKSPPFQRHASQGNTAGSCGADPVPPPGPSPPHPPPPLGLPAEHACLPGGPAAYLPFCNISLSTADRVRDLVGRLNITEKAGLMGAGSTSCAFMDAGVARLGIPVYTWCVEANTGAGGICLEEGRCQSTFPNPTAIAASFNRSVWRSKGEVISTELRVMNNLGGMRMGGPKDYVGINGWGPNVNIIRDPRYGRNSELPSECPLLAGEYASEVVRAMQRESENGKCMKVHASLKHYTAYSIEADRSGINEIISTFDLHDTYLPQYEAAFVKGRAAGVMCSYNSVNSKPMCGNEALLNTQIRGVWNRSDALIVTDCGAVTNMVSSLTPASRRLKNLVQATALSINSGVDLETGPVWTGDTATDLQHKPLPKGDLAMAVQSGAVTMETVDTALSRSLSARMRLGLFDPPSTCEFTKFTIEDIGSKNAAHAQALEHAAAQGLVLLRNERGALPLQAGTHIAVLGPHASTRAGLLSDYAGDSWCWTPHYTGSHKNTSCIPTIGESVARENAGGETTILPGVDVSKKCGPLGIGCEIEKAVAAAHAADVVILALGTSSQTDHAFPNAGQTNGEGHDRADMSLPGDQAKLASAVFAVGKPIVLVLIGGLVHIDKYVHKTAAIVEAFFPSLQTPVLAATLFGRPNYNRFGKLPVTYYAEAAAGGGLPWAMTDMNMSTGVGRTYRYTKAKTLWEFGSGLSLTNFSHSCNCNISLTCSCTLNNTGAREGDEVIMVYDSLSEAVRKSVGSAHPVPIRRLVDFQRASLQAGASTTLTFTITADSLRLVTADGSLRSYTGDHELVFSRGNGREHIVTVHV